MNSVQPCPTGKGDCATVLPDKRCFGCPQAGRALEQRLDADRARLWEENGLSTGPQDDLGVKGPEHG